MHARTASPSASPDSCRALGVGKGAHPRVREIDGRRRGQELAYAAALALHLFWG